MKKKSTKNENLIGQLELFKNNVLCRSDSNQSKARMMWPELRSLLSPEEGEEINTEWSHYLTGNELNTDEFGEVIQKIINKYK